MSIARRIVWAAVIFAALVLFLVMIVSLHDLSFFSTGLRTQAQETASHQPETATGLTERVILLGIDAGDWQVIDPLIDEGKLPTFRLIKEKGAWGELRSIKPMLSPPLWTTIITGQDRDKHGVGDFQQTDPKTKKKFFQTFSFNRKCPALWNILSARNLSSCVVNWWATWPADEIVGRMVSNHFVLSYVSRGQIEEGMTHPDALFHEIKDKVVDLNDPGEKKNLAQFFDNMPGAEKQYRNDETVTRIALYLLGKYQPVFCAAYLWELDHLKHIRWLKDMAEPDRLVKLYYTYLDTVLARFISRMDSSATLVVVSDHGFSRARHREMGIIALYGAGIRPGAVIENAVVRDVTPTLLVLLGQPVARDMDGKVLTDCFIPELLKEKPIRFIETYNDCYTPAQPVDTSETSKDLHKKLKSMGYIK